MQVRYPCSVETGMLGDTTFARGRVEGLRGWCLVLGV